MQVFKAHGMVQARIIDCASETFSAIRTVSVQFVPDRFNLCLSYMIADIGTYNRPELSNMRYLLCTKCRFFWYR